MYLIGDTSVFNHVAIMVSLPMFLPDINNYLMDFQEMFYRYFCIQTLTWWWPENGLRQNTIQPLTNLSASHLLCSILISKCKDYALNLPITVVKAVNIILSKHHNIIIELLSICACWSMAVNDYFLTLKEAPSSLNVTVVNYSDLDLFKPEEVK